MSDFINEKLLLGSLATCAGAFSFFPEKPKMIKDLQKNEVFNWLCLYILILQGGGKMNYKHTLAVTIIVFIVVKMLS